jgi:hypothetical protein
MYSQTEKGSLFPLLNCSLKLGASNANLATFLAAIFEVLPFEDFFLSLPFFAT